jgi:hypothetical protein
VCVVLSGRVVYCGTLRCWTQSTLILAVPSMSGSQETALNCIPRQRGTLTALASPTPPSPLRSTRVAVLRVGAVRPAAQCSVAVGLKDGHLIAAARCRICHLPC